MKATWTIKWETGLGDKSWHSEHEVQADTVREAINEAIKEGIPVDNIYSIEHEP